MNSDQEILSWLIDSDPSIRWQVIKDIQRLDENIFFEDRQDLSSKGWSSQLLHLQGNDGLWNNRIYNGKWISTTYTLFLLKLLGLMPFNRQALKGCDQIFNAGIFQDQEFRFSRNQDIQDLGVTGLVLSICCYFGYHQD